MRKGSVLIETGMKFGILTVGNLVYNVQSHPLFELTAPSYLRQGRLRECQCECGEMALYSENVLSSGQIKSCGCLRRKLREKSHYAKISRQEKKTKIREIDYQIVTTQDAFKLLRSRPSHMRGIQYEQDLQRLAARLRSLIAKKGFYSRKISPQEAWENSINEFQ